MILTMKEAIKHTILFHSGTSKTVYSYKSRNRLKSLKVSAVIREDVVSHQYPKSVV